MNCKVSSNIDDLEKLNNKYGWIPGKNNIRPNNDVINNKNNKLENAYYFYNTRLDYILDVVFKFKMKLNSDGKLEYYCKNIPEKKIFRKNDFPYDLPIGTNHYIMWYTYNIDDENQINNDIFESLKKELENENFEFIWYENPKMTIPEIYHVQVFWIKID